MQDNRRQLRNDKRGVTGMPLKLLVTMVVLCMMIPIVVNATETSENNMLAKELDKEAERIRDAVAVVYYSGSDSSRTLEFDLPQGCALDVGGDGSDAYSIRCSVSGETVSTKYFEKPIVGFDGVHIEGRCVLKITCLEDNKMGMCLV